MIRILLAFLLIALNVTAQTLELEKVCDVKRISDIRFAPGDDSRMYIVDQITCTVRVFDMNTRTLYTSPFIDVLNKTQLNDGQAGLLSLVFDPAFSTNRFFYLSYIGKDNDNVIARYKARNEYKGRKKTEKILLRSKAISYGQHFGGTLQFAPDGKLIASIGDGGDKQASQDIGSVRGKLIDIDTRTGVWAVRAIGFRNPWKFTFDYDTNTIFLGDVGDVTFEEVNTIPYDTNVHNYGWPLLEANWRCPGCYEGDITGLTPPLKFYHHNNPYTEINGTCIIGGYVYRGTEIPWLYGAYVFGDFMFKKLWSMTVAEGIDISDHSQALTNAGVGNLTTFGENNAGELFVGTMQGGVYKIGNKV